MPPSDLDAAASILDESFEARKKHGNRFGVAECLKVKGLLHHARGQIEEGDATLRLAHDLFKELQSRKGMAQV